MEKEDLDEMIRYCHLGLDAGSTRAASNLGCAYHMLKNDHGSAQTWLRLAASKDNKMAEAMLRNYVKAVAEEGNAQQAQYQLGLLHGGSFPWATTDMQKQCPGSPGPRREIW